MSKHTSGPWKLGTGFDKWTQPPEHWATVETEDGIVAYCAADNAPLVATAPKLLEALERIATECGSEVMGCDCAPPGNGEACPKCEIGYVAREAIAKVQGRG